VVHPERGLLLNTEKKALLRYERFNNSTGVLRVILRGAGTPPFSALWAVYFRAFPNWAAMLKLSRARPNGRKWATVPLREWKMKRFPGLVGLSTPILLLSLFTGLSGKPIFSQNASIAQQRLFWLGPLV
jgi:hypothetical protein